MGRLLTLVALLALAAVQAHAAAPASASRIVPTPPLLTGTPHNPSPDTSATFTYSDAVQAATFSCSLDSARYKPCGASWTQAGLAVKTHVFCVKAVAFITSAATCFTWRISSSPAQFGVSGNAKGLLYPGGPSVPVNLVLTNKSTRPVTVASVDMSVPGSTPGACATFVKVVSSLKTELTIPGRATVSLSGLRISTSLWPQLKMQDTGRSQDFCQGAHFLLGFKGFAVK